MIPPKAVVEKRRDLLTAIVSVAISANLTVVAADFQTWAAALRATEYTAWRLKGGDIIVAANGEIAGRHIRITAVFITQPAFMTREQAADLPKFESPKPAARHTFPEAA